MIAFLYPWALAGLAAAAIPVVLHFRSRRRPPTVPFPAVRYLEDAARRHERQYRLRHWLLLVLRTLLIVAVVLAAAGPTLPVRSVGPHAPAALAIVLDNSLSSGVTAGGTRRFDQLRAVARGILSRATPSDGLWLLAADGIPRRGDAPTIRRLVDSLEPSGARLDLGAAVSLAAQVVGADARPGGVVVVTDLQRSALSAASVAAPVLVAAVTEPRAANLGVAAVDPGPEPWSPDGGRVLVAVAGDSGAPVPVTVAADELPPREALVASGRPTAVAVPPLRPGWHVVRAQLGPDELRSDDERRVAIRVAAPARVSWDTAEHYLAAALATLADAGRVARGNDLTLGALGPGPSVVLPPADAAEVGALNRRLAARGVAWRFGLPVETPERTDSSAWLRPVALTKRYRLVPAGSGRTGVVLTAAGEPWLVRSAGVVLCGSRFDPAWTDLPLAAGFVPFVDALANRIARGEVVTDDAAAGEPTLLPDAVTAVRGAGRSWSVEGGAAFTPPEPGVYWLLAGRDTIGALAANADPRESLLAPATPAQVRALWPTARVVTGAAAGAAAFALGARSDLRGPLLWTALALAIAELLVAGAGARDRSPDVP